MSAANVLREFVVKLGWKVDEQQFRRFQESMAKTAKTAVEVSKNFVKLGEASALALTGMGATLNAIAKPMESLYFAAQRTGASGKELREFAFAAEQIGVSAEQAQGAVEGLAAATRNNPGLRGILSGMGIDPNQTDSVRTLYSLLVKLRALPHYQGAQIAGMFGINEQTFTMLENGLPEMQKYMTLREKMFRQAGIDPDQADKRAHEYMIQVRILKEEIKDLAIIMATRLMPIAEKVIGWIEQAIAFFDRADKATGGWSTRIVELGLALRALAASFSILGKLSGLSGLLGLAGRGAAAAGGAAVAGEAAGAGAAVAEGGGLLALIAPLLPAVIPVVVAAAIVAALAWMGTHPELVRKVVSSAWGWTKNQAKEINGIGAKVSSVAHSAAQDAKAAGGWVKALSLQPGFLGDLARMTGKFEGFRDHIYKDIAGKATFGFGHLVRPGEDVSHADPMALFQQDLKASLSTVGNLVKVHLSGNQLKSLADLEFNIGEKAFAGSTLLRKLNAGDFAGAADQFQYWNKVTQNGHKIANQSLSDRRAAEAKMFRSPDVTLNAKTDIHVEAGPNARETGNEVARRQTRVNGDLVRNFAGAVS
jgi:GH24 family phage-related lysozyme (muramidase)